MAGETSLATAAVVSDGDSAGGSSDSGSITSTASVGSTSSAPPQAQALTSLRQALLESVEVATAETVAAALGLKMPPVMLSPSTNDLKDSAGCD